MPGPAAAVPRNVCARYFRLKHDALAITSSPNKLHRMRSKERHNDSVSENTTMNTIEFENNGKQSQSSLGENLSRDRLCDLIRYVFSPSADDKVLTILFDLPHASGEDNPDWRERRLIASQWHQMLREACEAGSSIETQLYAYVNVGRHNADLPNECYLLEEAPVGIDAENVAKLGRLLSLDDVLGGSQMVIALTEYSATAPLTMKTRRPEDSLNFRAASMPGFSLKMVPSLAIDQNEMSKRVGEMKRRLDAADLATIEFSVKEPELIYRVEIDLRQVRTREAQAGIARATEPGAYNVPGGEAFIVPYEGVPDNSSRPEPSRTAGEIPVQFDPNEPPLIFTILENRAVAVRIHGVPLNERSSTGDAVRAALRREQEAKISLEKEPAEWNIAELGLGVLNMFGITPMGTTLLDEKCGPHIAFGRSDHLGGAIKASRHIDHVYLPSMQPAIVMERLELHYRDGQREEIVRHGNYLI